MYYARYIERMGTGIEDIVEKCLELGLPEPSFAMRDGFVSIIYRKHGIAFEKVSDTVNDTVKRLLLVVGYDDFSPKNAREKLSLRHRTYFLQNYIQPALKLGLIETTIPDKPNSRLQKYRLTEKGKELQNGYIDEHVKENEGLNGGLNENEGLNEGLKSLFQLISENQGIQAKDISDKLNNRPLKTIFDVVILN